METTEISSVNGFHWNIDICHYSKIIWYTIFPIDMLAALCFVRCDHITGFMWWFIQINKIVRYLIIKYYTKLDPRAYCQINWQFYFKSKVIIGKIKIKYYHMLKTRTSINQILPLITFCIWKLKTQLCGTDFMVNILIISLVRINRTHMYMRYQHMLLDSVECQDNGSE